MMRLARSERAWSLLRLAGRNLLRHQGRTAMTLAAVAFGVIALILSAGFVQDIFTQLAEAVIHSQSGHLQIAKRGYHAGGSRRPDQFLLADPAGVTARVSALPQVADVMARVSFSGLLGNGATDFSIVGEGMEPEREARLGTYVFIAAGRQLTDQDRYGMLVGEGVAAALKLQPGDRVSLLVTTRDGGMNTLEFEVTGIFQSFSKDYDARAVRIALADAQELLDAKGANVLVVSLHRTRDTAAVASELRALLGPQDLEVATWQELNDFYDKTVHLYDRQFGILRLIVLAMVLLSVANTVNMSIFERVGEFGTMRALGNRSPDVFRLVLAESLVLGLAGAVLGTLIGILLAGVISAVGIPMPPPPNANLGYVAKIRVVPSTVASAFAIGFVATVLASILPGVRVARLPVVEALRRNV
jgi:putative ABC transport system permease protein